jgi:hypothetical protein
LCGSLKLRPAQEAHLSSCDGLAHTSSEFAELFSGARLTVYLETGSLKAPAPLADPWNKPACRPRRFRAGRQFLLAAGPWRALVASTRHVLPAGYSPLGMDGERVAQSRVTGWDPRPLRRRLVVLLAGVDDLDGDWAATR